MNEELLPCPFCGGEAKFDKTVYKEVGVVRCQKCRASNGIVTQEHTANRAWNTRTPTIEKVKWPMQAVSPNLEWTKGANFMHAKFMEIIKERGLCK